MAQTGSAQWRSQPAADACAWQQCPPVFGGAVEFMLFVTLHMDPHDLRKATHAFA